MFMSEVLGFGLPSIFVVVCGHSSLDADLLNIWKEENGIVGIKSRTKLAIRKNITTSTCDKSHLFVLCFNIPQNVFSVMSELCQTFLGVNQ